MLLVRNTGIQGTRSSGRDVQSTTIEIRVDKDETYNLTAEYDRIGVPMSIPFFALIERWKALYLYE